MKRLCSIPSLIAFLLAAGGLHAQTVSTDKTSLSFSGLVGGSAVSQTLNITSSGGAINFFVFPNAPWLKVNPQSGTTPSAVTVTADPSSPTSLTPGTYNSTLSVFGGSSSVSVQVSFTVTTIGVNPQSLQFAYTIGGSVPGLQNIALAGQPTPFNAAASTTSGGNWLQVVPASGISPGSVTAILNPAVVPFLSVGTYNGTITITPAAGTSSTPVAVPVTLTVTPAPPVTANPATLSFNFQTGQTLPTAQNLTISTTGGQPVNFGFTSTVDPNPAGKNWITISPASGAIPASGSTQVAIGVDTAGLPPNTYNGRATLITPGGSPTQQDIAVKLLISSLPLLNVPSATLNFTYQLGAAAPAAQNVTCTATSGTLPFTITVSSNTPWLSAPASGSTQTPFPVTVDPSRLAPGTYTGTITVTGIGAGNGPQQIPVSLTVSNDPLIAASASSLSFPYQIGQALPSPQNIKVASSTGAPLNYTVTAATTTCGNSWLVLSGTTSGTTSGNFTASVNPAGLPAGACAGLISISATNASTGAAAINSPVTIAVTMYVSTTPLLVATPPAPSTFSVQVGAPSPAPQSFSLNSTSPTDQVNFSVTFQTNNGGNWLLVGPLSGATPNTLTLSVIPTLLSAGTYTGSVTVSATGAGGVAPANSPMTFPVTLQVTAGTLSLSSSTLSFPYTLGGAAPAAQTITVSSTGQPLTYTAVASNSGPVTWLSVTPAGGVTPGSFSVSVDGSKLTPGTYQGAVTVTSPGAGGSPATIIVTLTVNSGTISAAPLSLTFTQVAGGSAPASQNVAVSGTPGPIGFSVATTTSSGGAWLAATPQNGTTPGTVQVAVGASGFAVGSYNGTVTITAAAGAIGSPINIPVTLNVVAPTPITATPATLSFNYTIGLAPPQGQVVQVTSTGGVIPFTVVTQSTGAVNWLQAAPANGSTPNTLAVSVVNPQGLAAGSYTGTITILSSSALTPATVAVSLTVIAIPPPVVKAIANAASYAIGAVSPGENIVIFGTGVGPSDLTRGRLTGSGIVDTVAANTRVLFDGIPAPVIYVSAAQSSVMVPYEIAGRPTTTVRVEYQGVQSDPLTYNVVAAAAGIYTLNQAGTGPGAILNQDGITGNGPGTPAAKGSVVAVYMTGEGQTAPAGVNGAITPSDGSGLKKPVLTVTATVGGLTATVLYAGAAPGILSGVMQVNVQIPAAASSGAAIPLVISVGNTPTQSGVTVAVQ